MSIIRNVCMRRGRLMVSCRVVLFLSVLLAHDGWGLVKLCGHNHNKEYVKYTINVHIHLLPIIANPNIAYIKYATFKCEHMFLTSQGGVRCVGYALDGFKPLTLVLLTDLFYNYYLLPACDICVFNGTWGFLHSKF